VSSEQTKYAQNLLRTTFMSDHRLSAPDEFARTMMAPRLNGRGSMGQGDAWSESANGKNNAMSEDNAAKPAKTVGCRLFRGLFNKGWTETTGAVI
jgi:hypothetical protein